MGWLFIVLGITVIGVGSFLTYYGQDLLKHPATEEAPASRMVLSPTQERLLEIIANHQRRFAADKLIISRSTGSLYFDHDPERGKDVNMISELFGASTDWPRHAADFVRVMESIPSLYVRMFGESRLDNPFVVTVTDEGQRYLRRSN